MNKGFFGVSSKEESIEEAPLDSLYYGRRNSIWVDLKAYFDTIYQAIGTYLTSANIEDSISNGVVDKAPSENAVYDALALKLTANSPITGATKTKITYDANGLVTAGADLVAGDIPTLAYSSLSGRPTAETQTNNIFGCSAAGASTFSGTIATLPGGAPTTLTYNAGFTGNDNALVPTSTSQLGKLVLYNTTRGTSALISNSVVATKTITFTANVPAGWVVGDTITIASQTVTGGGVNWVDIQITSGPTGKTFMFIDLLYRETTTVGLLGQVHPLETYAASKAKAAPCYVANNTTFQLCVLLKIVSDTFSLSWQASGANTASVVIREEGYLE